MSYRSDDDARAARADALIREIAELERARVDRAGLDRQLDDARAQLALLQATPPAGPPERAPGLVVHALVFTAAAVATFAGHALLV